MPEQSRAKDPRESLEQTATAPRRKTKPPAEQEMMALLRVCSRTRKKKIVGACAYPPLLEQFGGVLTRRFHTQFHSSSPIRFLHLLSVLMSVFICCLRYLLLEFRFPFALLPVKPLPLGFLSSFL